MSLIRFACIPLLHWVLLIGGPVYGFLNATQDASRLVIANDRLYASVNKSTGAMDILTLDGQNLLGEKEYNEVTPGGNAAGQNGIGPYLDCYCVPSGVYTPGEYATFELFHGSDSSGVPYGDIVMSEVYPPTGQILEQYWFLRETETGLHTFSRLAYYNETKPFLRWVWGHSWCGSIADALHLLETFKRFALSSDLRLLCGLTSLPMRRSTLLCLPQTLWSILRRFRMQLGTSETIRTHRMLKSLPTISPSTLSAINGETIKSTVYMAMDLRVRTDRPLVPGWS